MQYVSYYESPLGKILLASDDAGLSGLWFVERQRYFAGAVSRLGKKHSIPTPISDFIAILLEAKRYVRACE